MVIGCQNMANNDNKNSEIVCPIVFFSSENNIFTKGDKSTIELDNIDYKASLNNYGFANECFSDNIYNNYNLDLLVLVEPINPKNLSINLPIFVIFYDNNQQVIKKEYFRIIDKLNYSEEASSYTTTDVVTRLNMFIEKENEIRSIAIGFVKIN